MRTSKSLLYSLLLLAMFFLAGAAILGTRDKSGNDNVKKENIATGYPETIDLLLRSS